MALLCDATRATVRIDNFTFAPERLTLKAGTTVTWRNKDDIPHTVTSATRLFKSSALDTDDTRVTGTARNDKPSGGLKCYPWVI